MVCQHWRLCHDLVQEIRDLLFNTMLDEAKYYATAELMLSDGGAAVLERGDDKANFRGWQHLNCSRQNIVSIGRLVQLDDVVLQARNQNVLIRACGHFECLLDYATSCLRKGELTDGLHEPQQHNVLLRMGCPVKLIDDINAHLRLAQQCHGTANALLKAARKR